MPATVHPIHSSKTRNGSCALQNRQPRPNSQRRSDNAPELRHTYTPRALSCIYAQRTFPAYTIKEGNQAEFVHRELSGYLDFWFYENPAFEPVMTGKPDDGVELFVGGLWGHTSSGVLQWLVNKFGHFAEFHDPSGHNLKTKKHPDAHFRGCAHIRVDTHCNTDLQDIIANLHCSVLFDQSGAWVARSETQKEHLAAYCATLKTLTRAALAEKVQGLPSHALTCEFAKRRTTYPAPSMVNDAPVDSHSQTQPTASKVSGIRSIDMDEVSEQL